MVTLLLPKQGEKLHTGCIAFAGCRNIEDYTIQYNSSSMEPGKLLRGFLTPNRSNGNSYVVQICDTASAHHSSLLLTDKNTGILLLEGFITSGSFNFTDLSLDTVRHHLRTINGRFSLCLLTKDYTLLFSRDSNVFYRTTDNDSILSFSSNFHDLCSNEIIDSWKTGIISTITEHSSCFSPNVKSLSSGVGLIHTNNKLYEFYCTPNWEELHGSTALKGISQYAEMTRNLMEETAVNNFTKYSHIGIMLSGGIDSSAAAYMLRKSGIKITAYSFVSDDFKRTNEVEYITEVCKALSIKLVRIPIHYNDPILQHDRIMAMPYGHLFDYWTLKMIERMREDDVDCVVDGLKADGLFGGTGYIHLGPQSLSQLPFRERIVYRREARTVPIPQITKLSFGQQHELDFSRLLYTDIFTDESKLIYMDVANGKLNYQECSQRYSLDLNTFRSYYLPRLSFYGMEPIYTFARDCIPDSYRRVPYGGATINKAVLRMALLDHLPDRVVKRNFNNDFLPLVQEYILHHKHTILEILGSTSILNSAGIIDSNRLVSLLSNNSEMAANDMTIFNSCMIELYLQHKNDSSDWL